VIPAVLGIGFALAQPVAAELGECLGCWQWGPSLSGQRREVVGRLPGQVHREFPLAHGRRCRRYLLSSTLFSSSRFLRCIAFRVVALRRIALRVGFCLGLSALPVKSGTFGTGERAGVGIARVLAQRLPAIPSRKAHVLADEALGTHCLHDPQRLSVIGAEQAIEGLGVEARDVAAVIGLACLFQESHPDGHDVAESSARASSNP